jgi:NAD(P)-dependent dehydrogenase (short-subunit alcohol dehydrogenase family)
MTDPVDALRLDGRCVVLTGASSGLGVGFARAMTAESDGQLGEMVANNSILGRFGEQHERDSALLFLASPASSYVTGASLLVDGGMSAL